MLKVQTLDKISSKGLDLLPREQYEVATEIPEPDAIILRSFKMHDMQLPESLKAVARAGAGINNIPIDKCTEKGIVVFNTPGANANGVKELVLTGMFIASRDIPKGLEWVKSQIDQGDQVPKLIEKKKSTFSGPEIKGKTLGIIGLGAIGAMVANDAEALGMDVIGYDPFISVESAWGLSSNIARAEGLESVLSKADYLSIHVPLTDKTRGMFDEEKFSMMKKGIRIMNFARGGLVDNTALASAIDEGIVAKYVTDFPDAEVMKLKNVIPLPHLGASTPESTDNCATMGVDQLRDYLEKGNITNSVNFPECSMSLSGDTRLIIANMNVPNMLGQITTFLADKNIKIGRAHV